MCVGLCVNTKLQRTWPDKVSALFKFLVVVARGKGPKAGKFKTKAAFEG